MLKYYGLVAQTAIRFLTLPYLTTLCFKEIMVSPKNKASLCIFIPNSTLRKSGHCYTSSLVLTEPVGDGRRWKVWFKFKFICRHKRTMQHDITQQDITSARPKDSMNCSDMGPTTWNSDKLENAWQSLAYSQLGAAVSPPSEYLWTLTYWSPSPNSPIP